MEFFKTAPCEFSPEVIQNEITGARLSELCDAIDRVLAWSDDADAGEIYCLWGQFKVRRERLRDGLRFTLPGCPNALAWTITTAPDGTLIHCTINRSEHDPDFIESIQAFIGDWSSGLQRLAEHDLSPVESNC